MSGNIGGRGPTIAYYDAYTKQQMDDLLADTIAEVEAIKDIAVAAAENATADAQAVVDAIQPSIDIIVENLELIESSGEVMAGVREDALIMSLAHLTAYTDAQNRFIEYHAFE